MAEPTGIFIEFDIAEKNLKKLLNHKFENVNFGKKLGYYFSELLYFGNNNPSQVFILNYNLKSQKCFIAYLPNHFEKKLIAPFDQVLQIISLLKKTETTNYAIVATTFPEVLEVYKMKNRTLERKIRKLSNEIVVHLTDKFWSFSDNNIFPEPKKAIKKRNYFYKNFKNYYKKYLIHIEELEKPNKIKQATKENPYHLFENFYSYNTKVFDFNTYTNQIIELPKADPMSFRNIAGIKADQSFVYLKVLASNSPAKTVRVGGYSKNNPKAIWKWIIADGIDGTSFEYVKERWDTIYWKDKDSVFILKDKTLKRLELADSKTFEYLDFCFGKDKNHIFYLDKVIPIDVNNYTLNKNGFISDTRTIFHYQHQILLDAKTFKVIEYASEVNPFIGEFILEDKNGQYKYNRASSEQILKPIRYKNNEG